jgi:putative RecB family exonuclease
VTDERTPAGAAPSGGAAPGDSASPRRPALSPSRAKDFKTCPLLYRLRAIDHIPEPPAPAAVRGTLVHAALEQMFGRPPAERHEAAVTAAIPELWTALVAERPELADLVPADELDAWYAAAGSLVHTYFGLEDPTRLEPRACEMRVEADLADGVPARGFIDRLDVSPQGLVRVVDYKTGNSPAERYAGDVLYQLKFYALMLYRIEGVVPARLRLVYLGDAKLLEYTPDEAELLAFERGVVALWRAIERATATGVFPPRRSRLCDWCSFQQLCPEFGGTTPPYPEPEPAPVAPLSAPEEVVTRRAG